MSKLIFSTAGLPEIIHFNVPLSKSISNRILVIDYLRLRKGKLKSSNNFLKSSNNFLKSSNKNLKQDNNLAIPQIDVSNSDDTKLIAQILQTIQATDRAAFDFKNSGTALRFLLSLLAVTKGHWTLTASARMESRAIKPLVDILNNLGASIISATKGQLFPLIIEGKSSLPALNKPVLLPAQSSSQTISSLLLIEEFIPDFSLVFSQNQSSMPYISMTKALIANPNVEIERCWSSAAFAYCLIGIRKRGSVVIPHLIADSIQGDSVAERLFRNFGVETTFTKEAAVLTFNASIVTKSPVEIDILHIPDLFLPLAVTAICFDKTTTFLNVSILRFKESDRLSAAIQLLNKLGIVTTNTTNGLIVHGRAQNKISELPIIPSFGDHRVVMSFSMLAFLYDGLIIEDPECVSKSFADFWSNFGITI